MLKITSDFNDFIIRSSRTDRKTKDRHCYGSYHYEGGKMVVVLEQTRTWFERDHFILKPGFKVFSARSPYEYVITDIRYPETRPFKTILVTEKIATPSSV